MQTKMCGQNITICAENQHRSVDTQVCLPILARSQSVNKFHPWERVYLLSISFSNLLRVRRESHGMLDLQNTGKSRIRGICDSRSIAIIRLVSEVRSALAGISAANLHLLSLTLRALQEMWTKPRPDKVKACWWWRVNEDIAFVGFRQNWVPGKEFFCFSGNLEFCLSYRAIHPFFITYLYIQHVIIPSDDHFWY